MSNLIIWCLFALYCGILEAFMFHNKIFIKHIHTYFTIFRLTVAFPLAYFNDHLPVTVLFMVLVFPFLHDGVYYYTRNILNPRIYPKKWFDYSTTSNAIVSLNIFWRLILFIFALGLVPLYL